MKPFHKIIALTMAFLVLFSTSAFAVSMHYCGNTLVNYSFAAKAKTCGMEKMDEQKTPSTCNIAKKNCCSDKKIVKNQDEIKASPELHVPQQLFVASFFYTYINLFEGIDQQIIPFKYYSPPLLVSDIQLLDETFLI
ncbi:HYC_CC_PP family protein [Mesonia aquimarina]|uniref:HYC_CC_PP family protein n=1 Tax=Mesonia aquimarina TaxID=1504967 RepID=UPI001F08FA51|nr:hypothetical protein [Mesonia aquimarina]